MSVLACLPDMINSYFEIINLKKRTKELEAQLENYKKSLEDLSQKTGVVPAPVPTPEPTVTQVINSLL